MTITLDSLELRKALKRLSNEILLRTMKDYQGIPICWTDRVFKDKWQKDAKRWFETDSNEFGNYNWVLEYSGKNGKVIKNKLKEIDSGKLDLTKIKNRHLRSRYTKRK